MKHLTNPKTHLSTFEGSLPLKMSDYNMKAPTAMLGVMKVGDQVTVKYNVTFEGPAVQFN
jgi:hypothetical protein